MQINDARFAYDGPVNWKLGENKFCMVLNTQLWKITINIQPHTCTLHQLALHTTFQGAHPPIPDPFLGPATVLFSFLWPIAAGSHNPAQNMVTRGPVVCYSDLDFFFFLGHCNCRRKLEQYRLGDDGGRRFFVENDYYRLQFGRMQNGGFPHRLDFIFSSANQN